MGRTSAGLREPLLAFAAATALAAGLAALGAVVPFVRDNLHAPIALIFLYVPAFAARRAGREFDYADAGLRADPVGLNLAVLGVFVALSIPAFTVGFFLFYGRVCTIPANEMTHLFGGLCRHWLGPVGGHLLVIPNPQRLAVFFPALVFGWMRARTGSIAAGATFHALCNVVSDVLHTSYFG